MYPYPIFNKRHPAIMKTPLSQYINNKRATEGKRYTCIQLRSKGPINTTTAETHKPSQSNAESAKKGQRPKSSRGQDGCHRRPHEQAWAPQRLVSRFYFEIKLTRRVKTLCVNKFIRTNRLRENIYYIRNLL